MSSSSFGSYEPHFSDSETAPSPTTQLPRNQRNSPQRQRPPRLPSPRLFREFFHDMPHDSSQLQTTIFPSNYADSVRDVNEAIRNANRAIQDAQEALQRTSSRSDVVDLTTSPPDRTSSSRFLTHTVHPHDSAARQPHRMNSLNQPVYGAQSSSRTTHRTSSPVIDPSDSGLRARMRRSGNYRRFIPLPQPPGLPAPLGRNTRMEEEQAVRRQREARNIWERTRRRNERRQNTQQEAAPQPHQQPRPPSSSPRSTSSTSEVEAVDLTAVEDNTSLAAALSRQRQEAVASQNSSSGDTGRTPLSAYKCPICMETPQDATTTVCGHLFCHKCIINTLKWSENQRREEMPAGRRPRGTCPVCRKELSRNENHRQGRHVIPLEIKFMTRKRKRDKGKGVERHGSEGVDGSGKENKRKKNRSKVKDEDLFGEFTNDII